MNTNRFEIIFVVVHYNTIKEIENLLENLKCKLENIKYRVLCVDNFSSKETLEKLKNLKNVYNFDLIENDNTGYGDGNNKGIEFALQNYDFDFIVISNPDIELINFNIEFLKRYTSSPYIIAPKIINLNNKNQNPFYIKKHPSLFYLFNLSQKYNSHYLQLFTIVLSKIYQKVDKFFIKNQNIYAPHGSFIILNKKAIKKLHPIFDSKMFLLCEEIVLAEKARKLNIPILYEDRIQIKHFEDASMKTVSLNSFEIWKKSYKIFYDSYYYEK